MLVLRWVFSSKPVGIFNFEKFSRKKFSWNSHITLAGSVLRKPPTSNFIESTVVKDKTCVESTNMKERNKTIPDVKSDITIVFTNLLCYQ